MRILIPIVMDMEDIKNRLTENYDGAVSNFNGFNYISEPADFAASLSKVLKPKSTVIFTVLNRKCGWEFIYYMLKLHPKKHLDLF